VSEVCKRHKHGTLDALVRLATEVGIVAERLGKFGRPIAVVSFWPIISTVGTVIWSIS